MIILYIIGGLLLLGLIGKLFELIKRFLPYVLGIAAIAAVIIFFPTILTILTFVAPILIGLLVIGIGIVIVQNIKYRPFLNKLENAGILNKIMLPNEEKAISYAIEKGKALPMEPNFLLSAKLLENMESRLSSRDVITNNNLVSAVGKKGITDSPRILSSLFSYLAQKDILIPVGDDCYITRRFCQYCQTLLEREGAATAEEFTSICASSELASGAKAHVRQVSAAALQWMIRQNAAKKTDLPESKMVLYIAQNQKNSKMVRRVINLDEDG